MSNIESYYKLGKILGLTAKDIDRVLKNRVSTLEKSSNELGPIPYKGGFYGTISVRDF